FMNHLLRPRIWPSFLASSGVPSTGSPRLRSGQAGQAHPATYRSGTPRNQSRGPAGRLPGGTPIFMVWRQQFMKYSG
ncbi:MAG: hypothetical protein WBH05_01735, partial [Syntrophobacteria bacterium]